TMRDSRITCRSSREGVRRPNQTNTPSLSLPRKGGGNRVRLAQSSWLPRRRALRALGRARGLDLGLERAQRLLDADAAHRGDDERLFSRRPLEPRRLLFEQLRREPVGLRQRDDLRLVRKPVAVRPELGPHRAVGLARILAGPVDEMQQHAAALDVTEKTV